MRSLYLTAGGTENVAAVITRAGDLTGVTVSLALSTADTVPTTWLPAAITQLDVGTVQASARVSSTNVAGVGQLWLWVRIANGAEVVIRRPSTHADFNVH